jgi:deazaflavin-dependent oxidoreductase (nitroreductase family)
MPLPKRLARFNRRVTNPVVRTFAGWVPGLAIVIHTGRTSGREYRTPVNVFASRDGGYVLALTYGRDVQWARNVLASGGCAIQTLGRRVQLVAPRVVHDPSQRLVPNPARAVLQLLGVEDFMLLDRASAAAGDAGRR